MQIRLWRFDYGFFCMIVTEIQLLRNSQCLSAGRSKLNPGVGRGNLLLPRVSLMCPFDTRMSVNACLWVGLLQYERGDV